MFQNDDRDTPSMLLVLPDGRVVRHLVREPPRLTGWYEYPPEPPRDNMTIDFGASALSSA